MSSIDNRIVQMEFDNAQFERGVSTTMKTLDNLDNRLDTLGSGGSFSDLASTVDTIANRFSNLGIIGMSVLQNITDRVVDLGINMAKSLTIDNVSAGFQKYESITKATQAIVNQAKVSYDEAAKYVEKLAWYSDATSFDLSSMVGALQQFVSQGIKMDKAIPIIMGIGNSVTYAGQSAKEGSAAFQYYAKAMASGNLQLVQWRSLAQALHVTTAQLKQDLIDAAVNAGTLYRDWEGNARNFDDNEIVDISTFEKYLNAADVKFVNAQVIDEVFGTKYGKYASNIADATIKWQKEHDKILDVDTALKMFGDTTDKVGEQMFKSAFVARTFSEAMDAVRDAVSTAFHNMFTAIFGYPEEAIELWTEFNTWLVNTFAQPIVDVSNILKSWHDFGVGGRKILIGSIKDIYHAFEHYVAPIGEFIDEITPDLTVEGLYDATLGLSEFAEGLEKLLSGDAASEWKEIQSLIQYDDLSGPFEFLNDLDSDQFAEWVDHWRDYVSIGERLNDVLNGIIDGLRIIKDVAITIFEPFKKLKEPIMYFVDGMLTIASNIGKFISGLEESGAIVEWFKDRLGPLETIIDFVSKAIKKCTDLLVEFSSSKSIGEAINWVGKFVDGLHPLQTVLDIGSGIFEKFADGIRTVGKAIRDTIVPVFGNGFGGKAAGGTVGFILVLRTLIEGFDDIKWSKKLFSPIGILENIRETLVNLSDILEDTVNKIRVQAFKDVAKALLIMAAAFLIIASINKDALLRSIGVITGLMVLLAAISTAVNKWSETKLVKGIIQLGITMLLLSVAFKAIASVDSAKVADAFLVISGLMFGMVKIGEVASRFEKGNHLKGLTGMAVSIIILSGAIAILGNIQTEKLLQGTAALSVLLLGITLFVNAISSIDTTGFATAMLGVVELSAGLLVLSGAIALFGVLGKDDSLTNGIVGLIAVLATIFAFSAVIKDYSKDFAIVGAGLIEIGAAILIISAAMAVLSLIPWENIQNGFLAIGLTLAGIGLFASVLKGQGASLAALGAGMLVMSAAILVMSAAFAVLGAIGLDGITLALLAVFGAMVGFGMAGAIIGGAAVVGMLAFAAGLAAISAALIVLGNALIKIATAMLIFKMAFGQTSTDVTNQFNNSSEQISKSAKNVEENVTTSAENIEKTVTESNDAIESDVESTNTQVVSSSSDAWSSLVDMIGLNNVKIMESAGGMTEDIKNKFDAMGYDTTQITELFTTAVSGDFTSMNEDTTGEVDSMATDVSKSFSDMGADLESQTSGIGSNLSISWKSIGHNLMEGLKQGIRNKWNNLLDTMASLGNQMQNTYQYTMGIYSPSRVFAKYGEYIDQGLINGINSYSNRVMDTTENLGESVLNSFSDPMKQVASIANSDFTISPKITPVLDTTNIQNGKNYLESMFSGRNLSSSINGNINANLSAMSGISGDIGSLKNEIARMVAGQLNETVLSQALASAMKNVDLYMDGAKVGKMITSYQSSVNRAGGI